MGTAVKLLQTSVWLSLAVLSFATGSLTPAPPRPQIAVAIAGEAACQAWPWQWALP